MQKIGTRSTQQKSTHCYLGRMDDWGLLSMMYKNPVGG